MEASTQPELNGVNTSALLLVMFLRNACAETLSLNVPVITRLAETLRELGPAFAALTRRWQKPWPRELRRCVCEVMRGNCGGELQCYAAIDDACRWLFEREGDGADPLLWDLMDARDELADDPQNSVPEAAREPKLPNIGMSRHALRCTTLFASVLVGELLDDPATARGMAVFMMGSSWVEMGEEIAAAVAKSVGHLVTVAGC